VRAALEAEADQLGADQLYERLAGVDPVAAARIDPANVRRTIRALEVSTITGAPFSDFAAAWERYDSDRVRAAGVRLDTRTLDARVRARIAGMLDAGWLDEVRSLVARGFGAWLTATQAIGYAELAEYLEGELAIDEAMERTVRRTKELARRQMAWFRRDPRIRWFDADERGAIAVFDDVRMFLEAA
jgi:tRNA dimethylallyltransferase